jgi:lysophospholipid acyltransferase (LPLAT)-like uncharacterized protein
MRLFSPTITGSLNITGSTVLTGSLFVKSTSNDIFIIKNGNNTPVLTVSQSGIVVLSTQSINPIGIAPNGGIYFTSSSLFVGLD